MHFLVFTDRQTNTIDNDHADKAYVLISTFHVLKQQV